MKRILGLMLILCLLTQSVFVVEASNDRLNVSINSSTRHVVISGIVEDSAMVTVLHPDYADATLSPQNIADAIVFTQQVSGTYNLNFTLPEKAAYGTYKVNVKGKMDSNTTTFNYNEYSSEVIYNESFDNALLWKTDGMGVINGKLFSKSTDNSKAVLKTDATAGFKNAKFDIKFSLNSHTNGWFQFVFRDNGSTAERLLIRKGRICRYFPGAANTET